MQVRLRAHRINTRRMVIESTLSTHMTQRRSQILTLAKLVVFYTDTYQALVVQLVGIVYFLVYITFFKEVHVSNLFVIK